MTGFLLALSLLAAPQSGSISPSRPQAAGEVVLRYDASDAGAILDPGEELFATIMILAPSGATHRAVALSRAEGDRFEGTTQVPADAAHLKVTFASRWVVDQGASVASMIYDDQGRPVPGARAHSALSPPSGCLDVVAAELEAHPTSYGVYRAKWFYISMFEREKGLEGIEDDLAAIGEGDAPEALMARAYMRLVLGQEAKPLDRPRSEI